MPGRRGGGGLSAMYMGSVLSSFGTFIGHKFKYFSYWYTNHSLWTPPKKSLAPSYQSGIPGNPETYEILYTPYISQGFYFCEFRESGAIREFKNTQK